MLAINSMHLNLDFFPILYTLPLNYSFKLLTISIIIYIIGFSSTTLLSDPSVFTFFLLFLFFFLIIFNYVYGIGGMYAWVPVPTEVRCDGLTWVLATDLGSSGRAVGTHNHWAISPGLCWGDGIPGLIAAFFYSVSSWFLFLRSHSQSSLPLFPNSVAFHSDCLEVDYAVPYITTFSLCSSKLEFGKLLGCESPKPMYLLNFEFSAIS